MSKKKKKRPIRIGSMDVYITPYNGFIPSDEELESDENFRGHTKNGATFGYESELYTASSDDGKVKRTRLISEKAWFEYGNITWDSAAMEILITTARRGDIANGRRRTEIGGIANDDDTSYIIRAVHRDNIAGDIRITGIGKNTNGWNSVFNNQENVITSKFEFEPELDDEGTLAWYDEDCMSADTLSVTLAAGSSAGKTKVTTVYPETDNGNTLKYKVADNVEEVFYDETCTSGWTSLTVGTEFSVTAGKVVTVVEVDANNKAKRCGAVTVIDNIG